MQDPHAATADYWGANVRRIKEGNTLKCQELVDGQWVTFRTTDEMANNFAYTDSSGWCRLRATKYIGGH